jgi:hypothetical protein
VTDHDHQILVRLLAFAQRQEQELHDLRLEVTATRALLERRTFLRAVPFIESADDLPGAS